MPPAARTSPHPSRPGPWFAEAAVTVALLVLAWLALDDITTDISTGFVPEYWFLSVCAAWGIFLACHLLARGEVWLGGVSLLALATSGWVTSDGLGHVRDGGWPVFWPEYSLVSAAWLWFLALAVILARKAMTGGMQARRQQ